MHTCKKIFVILVVLWASCATTAWGSEINTITETKALNTLTPGTSNFELWDALYPSQGGPAHPTTPPVSTTWHDGYCFNSVNGKVILALKDVFPDCPPDTFSCIVIVNITYWDSNNVPHTISGVKLTVTYDKNKGKAFKEKDIYVLGVAHYIKVSLVSVSNAGVAKYINLGSEIEKDQHKCDMDITSQPGIAVTYNSPTDEIVVTLNSAYPSLAKFAEEYDLEWTVVDKYDAEHYPGSANWYSFAGNATRVTVHGPEYRITNVFEKCTIMFRARMVGYYNGYRIPGKWSNISPATSGAITTWGSNNALTCDNGFFNDESSSHYIVITTTLHEPKFNWQYSVTYAEEGKKKETTSYFDGSLRNRQVVTKNNTDNTAIVKETVYDYQGRAAIEVLPAPVGSGKLEFYEDFNINAAGKPYGRKDFDKDISLSAWQTTTSSMATTSGASKYYSTANALAATPSTNINFNNYIPVAGGFPFVQTEFMPDNTGRIIAKTAIGDNHKLGSTHETRYMYETPFQEELDRLFGNEVGYNVHYKKNTVVDANGQFSVSYLDMKGRTIATGLAATSPGSVSALSSNAPRVDVEVDLITPETPSLVDDAIVLTKTITVKETGDYEFKYAVTPQYYQSTLCEGEGSNPCYDCLYDLEISIKDMARTEKMPGGTSLKKVIGGSLDALNASCSSPSEYNFFGEYGTEYITVNLTPGTYTISKKLAVSEKAYQFYEADFVQEHLCKTLEDFKTEAWASMEKSGCEITCEQCTTALAPFADADAYATAKNKEYEEANDGAQLTTAQMNEYRALYNRTKTRCNKICNGMSICDTYLELLKHDMMPGGQYAAYHYNETTDVVIPETSPTLNILNTFTTSALASFTVTINGVDRMVSSLSKTEFVKNFKDEWADVLVADIAHNPHPEYCQYTWCKTTNAASSAFDEKIAAAETYAEAEAAGVLTSWTSGTSLTMPAGTSPAGKIIDPVLDPFFKTSPAGLGVSYQSAIWGILTGTPGAGVYPTAAWDAAVLSIFCSQETTAAGCSTCVAAHRGDILTCNPAYRDEYWRMMKAIYLTEKKIKVNLVKPTYCAPSIPSGGVKRITDDQATPSTYSQAQAQNDINKLSPTDVTSNCAIQCASYKPVWKDNLAACQVAKGLLNTEIDFMLDEMYKVCIKGCDENYPMGASTVSPAFVNDIPSITPYKSFQDVITKFPADKPFITGHTNIYLRGVCDDVVIKMPMPYGHDYFATASPYADTCKCDDATPPADCPCNQTSTNNGKLNSLLKIEMNDEVPDAQKCKNCIDCAKFLEIYNLFIAKYPDFDETVPADQLILEIFFNQKAGFNLKYIDYLWQAARCLGYDAVDATTFDKFKTQQINADPELPSISIGQVIQQPIRYTPENRMRAIPQHINYGEEILLASDADRENGYSYQSAKVHFMLGLISKAITIPHVEEATSITAAGTIPLSICICKGLLTDYSSAAAAVAAFPLYPGSSSEITNAYNRCKDAFNQGFSADVVNPPASLDWPAASIETFQKDDKESPLKIDCSLAHAACPDLNSSCVLPIDASDPNNGGGPGWIYGGGTLTLCQTLMPVFKTYYDANYATLPAAYDVMELSIDMLSKCSSATWVNNLVTQLNLYGARIPTSLSCSDKITMIWNLVKPCRLTDCSPFLDVVKQFEIDFTGAAYPLPHIDLAYALPDQLKLTDANAVALKTELLKRLNAVYNRPPYLKFINEEEMFKMFTSCSKSPCDIISAAMQDIYENTDPAYQALFTHPTLSFKVLLQQSGNASILAALLSTINSSTYRYPYFIKIDAAAFVKKVDGCWSCESSTYDLSRFQTLLNAFTKPDPQQTNFPSATPPIHRIINKAGWLVSAINYAPEIIPIAFSGAIMPASLKYNIESTIISDAELKVSIKNGLDIPFNIQFNTCETYAGVGSILGPPASVNFSFHRISNFVVNNISYLSLSELHFSVTAQYVYGGTSYYQDLKVVLSSYPFYQDLTKTNTCKPKKVLLCNKPINNYQFTIDEDPCLKRLRIISENNALNSWNTYVTEQKQKFRAAYVAQCLLAKNNELFKMRYDERQYHYTLYYYDQAGNLVKTVPPSGVYPMHSDTVKFVDINRRANQSNIEYALNAAYQPRHNQYRSTTYVYNTLNQLVEQKTPDAGISKFYYDRVGRIVFSQNAKQIAITATDRYSYTMYDGLGRITEVGQVDRTLGATPVITQTYLYAPTTTTNMNNIIGIYAPRTEVTITTYDAQVFHGSDFSLTNLRSRVAHTAIYNAYDKSNPSSNIYQHAVHYSYDIQGNVKTLYRDITGLATVASVSIGQDLKEINYDYDVVSGKVNKVTYQDGEVDRYIHKYDYDAENRIIASASGTSLNTVDDDAHYKYYQHGPLARTLLGYYKVQGIDYTYTVNGWLKSVNSATLNNTRDPGRDANASFASSTIPIAVAPDVFGFSLGYFEGDYLAAYSSFTTAQLPEASIQTTGTVVAKAPAMYNGNIRYMQTNISQFSPLLSAYKYDQLNRLSEGNYFSTINTTTNLWDNSVAALTAYYNSFTYDADGNILTQTRNGAAAVTAMDNLTYKYNSVANNKLLVVDDAVSASGNYDDDIDDQDVSLGTFDPNSSATWNYNYDEIGNLVKDKAEEIETIQWTVYGKIKKIIRTTGSLKPDLEFEYSPDGHRVSKIVTPKIGEQLKTYTYYVRDAQGNIMATYTRKSDKIVDYDALTYTAVNDAIIAQGTATGFATFISTLHSGALNNTAFNSYLETQVNLSLTVTKNVLYLNSPIAIAAANISLYDNVINAWNTSQFITAFISNNGSVAYADALCTCVSYATLMNGIIADNAMLESFFRTMSMVNPTQYTNIMTAIGCAGPYLPISPLNVSCILSKKPLLPAALTAQGYGTCGGMSNLYAQTYSFFPSQFLTFNIAIANIKNMLASTTGYSCATTYSHTNIITGLVTAAGSNAMWDQMVASNGGPYSLGKLKSSNLPGFLYSIAYLQKAYVAAYQQANNMYGTTGNGMREYFAYIKSNFSQVVYDNILNTFYNTNPSTYTDSINLSSWHIYGSSRLGIYQTDINLVNVKYTATGVGAGSNITYLATPTVNEAGYTNFNLQRGSKNYELTNHLGNVLAVVSDKKLPTCSTTVITGYTADVLTQQDYSPFGAPLADRSYDAIKEASRNILLKNTFTSTVESWAGTTGSAATVSVVSTQLKVTYTAINQSARLYASVFNGKDYLYRVKVDFSTGATPMELYVKDATSGTKLCSLVVSASGSYILKFKATSGGAYLHAAQSGTLTGTVGNRFFYIDDVVLEENKILNPGYAFGFNGKEKDDETYGAGGEYDYGSRIYNPRLGRWFSTDPSQVKYPNLSPYNAFENSPIYLNDPDGKDAGYTIKDGTITFTAQIYISGSSANGAKAAEMQKEIMSTFGKDFKYTDENGKAYNVKFDVTVAVLDPSDKAQQENFQKGTANIVSLVSNPKEGFRDKVIDGNTGVWKEESSKGTRGHETGHLFGLEDTYYDVYTPKIAFLQPTNEYGYNISSQDYSSTKPNDIMGNGANRANPSIQKVAIDDLAKYALSNKSNTTSSDGTVKGKIDASKVKLGGPKGDVPLEAPTKPLVISENTKH